MAKEIFVVRITKEVCNITKEVCNIKILLQQKNKNYFKKIHHPLFNNQSSSSSEINNITQKGEAIFNKNPTVGVPGVSKLIDSAINKRQGEQRKHSFFERKKNTP